ncbi:MAG: UDP-3-O-acyl-N-acetylglucosamine deacetylase [Desulfatibacillaceae bacterium]
METAQTTIARTVECEGVGLHSGKTVHMRVAPAPANHGIRFSRVDLPNSPTISAIFKNVVDTSLATVIGEDGVIVSTIEHLMAAFAGMGVDNALVELDAYEVPVMDGSAGPFARMLAEGEIRTLDTSRWFFRVLEPIELSDGVRWVRLEPADGYLLTCVIDFPHPLINELAYTFDGSGDVFVDEISPARTFGFVQELEYLRLYGFAKGGSLDNAVVLDTDTVVNEDGLRFEDEFVRHKLLDCLGDFSLLGLPILGKLTTYKSGHAFNHAFLETFFTQRRRWRTVQAGTRG